MKSILIVVPGFYYGGTIRSLINLLNKESENKDLSIHILSMDCRGDYSQQIKAYSVLPEDFLLMGCVSFLDSFRQESITHLMKRLLSKAFFKFICRGDLKRIYQKAAKKYSGRYDTVAAFQEGHATQFASCIQSKNKVAWVRCDYSNYQQRFEIPPDESTAYQKFNRIVCVSDYTASVFRSIYPALSDKTIAIHNLIDTDGIKKDAMKEKDVQMESDGFKIISVGRMDPVKRFSCIPLVAAQMLKNGCSFRWYLVGAGGEEFNLVKMKIQEFDVEQNVILLGAKKNPYPFIAASNVLVCPSISEACPNVVNEAKILHVPVVAADFPSAREYIQPNKNGMIAPIDQIATILTKIILDQQYYKQLKDGACSFEYDNEEIMACIETVLTGEDE